MESKQPVNLGWPGQLPPVLGNTMIRAGGPTLASALWGRATPACPCCSAGVPGGHGPSVGQLESACSQQHCDPWKTVGGRWSHPCLGCLPAGLPPGSVTSGVGSVGVWSYWEGWRRIYLYSTGYNDHCMGGAQQGECIQRLLLSTYCMPGWKNIISFSPHNGSAKNICRC